MDAIERNTRHECLKRPGRGTYFGGDGRYCFACNDRAVDVEYVTVRADAHEGAVEALDELVRLKDGPRDDAYRAAKDAAWETARRVLKANGVRP